MTDLRDRLRGIRTFPSLVKFLRDELDWPIDSTDDFEELTFDYTPDELGIDEASAAKIDEIKRLRPLAHNQPWGIFFVKFEPKQLPVVALRRILNGVVVKKRATASAAEQPKWATDDLLFISAYGPDEERRISFAHFSRDPATTDLPTLKVLAWDDEDTGLHLDDVARRLVEHLSWPTSEDEWDDETWRERWRSAFELRPREVVTTSKVLATRLAELARAIRSRINSVLEIESEDGPVTTLMNAFRESLVHDLERDDFADMYAQTIAYGLLSARVANPSGDSSAEHLPVTNPFLRELMETFLHVGGSRDERRDGIDFDELGVSEVVGLLDNSKMDAVVRDFGDRNPQEDPVIHFYELFLKEYDAKKRMQRGVFYTPRPVVSYIVRSVDEQLRTHFGLEDGLADTITWAEMAERDNDLSIPDGVDPGEAFVQILDPATGTGTFLVEVIEIIHRRMTEKWRAQGMSPSELQELWNQYVPEHLLPRLHGYELLMAPYAIAHLKVGLKLHETGYLFGSEERARVYLTNALEPPKDFADRFEFAVPALAHEAHAVNEVKRNRRFTAVVGNPPYSGHSWNLTPELRRIVDPYRFVGSERIRERGALQFEKNLQDDYVKFVRLAENHIRTAGRGVVGMVTSHGFLDSVFLRGMRFSLLTTFDKLFVLDLHGNVLRGDKSPEGSPDKNVFDIKQTGVAISILTRLGNGQTVIQHADLWGDRDQVKFPFLGTNTVTSTTKVDLDPSARLWLFIPQDISLLKEYESGISLIDAMPLRSLGVVTGRDAFVTDRDDANLIARMTEFASARGTDEELDERFALRSSTWWSSSSARDDMPPASEVPTFIRRLTYRPFDTRYCFYHPAVFESLRRPVMQNFDLGRTNLLLLTTRMTKGEPFAHAFVSGGLAEAILLSSKTSNSAYVFPMFIYAAGDGRLAIVDKQENFAPEFRMAIDEATGLSPTSEEILCYIYAVLHSPVFRSRYVEFLKNDFPRILLPGRPEIFGPLALIGEQLMGLHLLESPKVNRPIATYVGPPSPEVKRVEWVDETTWLDAPQTKKGEATRAGTIGFRGVPKAVWNFHVGGYQVCHKWLKDRKGRTLSEDDIEQYQEIVVAISETIRLMQEIDEVIDEHGGWPGAFVTSSSEVLDGDES